jgi:hypothetical protein
MTVFLIQIIHFSVLKLGTTLVAVSVFVTVGTGATLIQDGLLKHPS